MFLRGYVTGGMGAGVSVRGVRVLESFLTPTLLMMVLRAMPKEQSSAYCNRFFI